MAEITEIYINEAKDLDDLFVAQVNAMLTGTCCTFYEFTPSGVKATVRNTLEIAEPDRVESAQSRGI